MQTWRCTELLPFIFQKDSVPTCDMCHTELAAGKLSQVIEKNDWSPNAPDFNPLDHRVTITSTINSSRSLRWLISWKSPCICEELLQEHISKAVANFTERLAAYIAVAANDDHLRHHCCRRTHSLLRFVFVRLKSYVISSNCHILSPTVSVLDKGMWIHMYIETAANDAWNAAWWEAL